MLCMSPDKHSRSRPLPPVPASAGWRRVVTPLVSRFLPEDLFVWEVIVQKRHCQSQRQVGKWSCLYVARFNGFISLISFRGMLHQTFILMSHTFISCPLTLVQWWLISQANSGWLNNPKAKLGTSLWICSCCHSFWKWMVSPHLTYTSIQFPKVMLPYLFAPWGTYRCRLLTTYLFPQRLLVNSPPHTLCRFVLTSDFAQPRLELRLAEQV